MSDDKNHPMCLFFGGSLDGKYQRRLMFGMVTRTVMEPLYKLNSNGDCLRSEIARRQVYRRDRTLDDAVALGYRLYAVLE